MVRWQRIQDTKESGGDGVSEIEQEESKKPVTSDSPATEEGSATEKTTAHNSVTEASDGTATNEPNLGEKPMGVATDFAADGASDSAAQVSKETNSKDGSGVTHEATADQDGDATQPTTSSKES